MASTSAVRGVSSRSFPEELDEAIAAVVSYPEGPRDFPDRQGHRADVALLLGRFGTGGVERVGCLLQNGFAERGLRVEVLVADGSGPLASLLNEEVRVVELGARRSEQPRSLALLLSVPRLARHLRRMKPRVLLSPGNHTNIIAALAHWLASGDTQLVLKITNPILKKQQGPVSQLLRWIVYNWAFSRAAQVLVLSRHSERQIANIWRAAAAKVRFVYNPYVSDLSAAARAGKPRDNTVPEILSIGRLTPQKNHALLFLALARLTDLRWRLVLLGEGPLKDRLLALADELGIADRVEFRGFVPDPSSFYQRAHVLALSSDWEDLPAVVFEALAAGVPVVSTACSEALVDVMREANHGQLTEPGDVAAFANALRQLILHPLPPTPFEGAKRYSIENGVDDHATALQPLLNCSTSPT